MLGLQQSSSRYVYSRVLLIFSCSGLLHLNNGRNVCPLKRKMIWRRLWMRAPGSVGPTATTLTWLLSMTTWTRPSTSCWRLWNNYSRSHSGFPSAGSTDRLPSNGQRSRVASDQKQTSKGKEGSMPYFHVLQTVWRQPCVNLGLARKLRHLVLNCQISFKHTMQLTTHRKCTYLLAKNKVFNTFHSCGFERQFGANVGVF